MAEALFNAEAARRGLPFRAGSAGTVAGTAVNQAAIEAMREIGIPMDAARPKQLTQEAADAAVRIITMGCGVDADACPARIMVTEDWGLDDPAGRPMEKVREIRDQIRERVDALLEELKKAR